MNSRNKTGWAAVSGAAFLMATSAIGPGFINNTTVFTQTLAASFGFVILISVLLDVVVQLNLWRIITSGGAYAQEIANQTLPGMGYVLIVLVSGGGLLFNIGNIAGAALGLQVLTGCTLPVGALISTAIAIFIFMVKNAGRAMDVFARVLGLLMIGLMAYVCFRARPDVGLAIQKTFIPDKINGLIILTIVGGTVGGYISFAGAHRLLEAGVTDTRQVTRGAVSGILIASAMRYLLFLAALGVVAQQVVLSGSNPAATVFSSAAGAVGKQLFGLVLWCAAITSVVGSAFTSVSFLQSLHPVIARNKQWVICIFILVSTTVFIFLGRPVQLLTFAGAANGFILPVALGIMLWAVYKKGRQPHYRHPQWLWYSGCAAALLMGYMGVKEVIKLF
ncbi:MAG: divalent metal cation transporter [Dinghuibacter sp.]|nr:divalent metal cation transporter [Dinghuibacter sp.]